MHGRHWVGRNRGKNLKYLPTIWQTNGKSTPKLDSDGSNGKKGHVSDNAASVLGANREIVGDWLDTPKQSGAH